MARRMAIIGITLGLLFTYVGCYSAPTPIIIRPLPELTLDVTNDEAYIRESSKMVVKLGAYIEEMINQIQHKVPHIDLRKTNDTGKK